MNVEKAKKQLREAEKMVEDLLNDSILTEDQKREMEVLLNILLKNAQRSLDIAIKLEEMKK